jgi:hypothetical protein
MSMTVTEESAENDAAIADQSAGVIDITRMLGVV